MEIRICLLNEFGTFKSKVMDLTGEQYDGLIDVSKRFYEGGGFETHLEDGFMVVPPDIVRKSILIIEEVKHGE